MFRISSLVLGFFLMSSLIVPMAAQQPAPAATITGSGTADFVPVFTGATTIGNSTIFQTVGGNVGVATTTPAAKLDVKGTEDVRDTLTLFPKLTHPVLSVHGTALSVDHTGTLTFVAGQKFPGAGTVTSVGSGAGLTGGPITHSGTLSIASGGVTNAMLQNSSLSVTTNSPLTGGGAVSLGGSTSIGLTNGCSTNQILEWNGSSWVCANSTTGYSASGSSVALAVYPGALIAQSSPVVSGTYFVSASTLLVLASGDGGFCYITTVNNAGTTHNYGGTGLGGSYVQASNTDVWTVSAGDAFQLWCYNNGSSSEVFNSYLTATLMNNSFTGKKARVLRVHPQ